MAKKLQPSFQFFNTEEEARNFEKAQKPWRRGSVTPWESHDGREHKYVAFYKF